MGQGDGPPLRRPSSWRAGTVRAVGGRASALAGSACGGQVHSTSTAKGDAISGATASGTSSSATSGSVAVALQNVIGGGMGTSNVDAAADITPAGGSGWCPDRTDQVCNPPVPSYVWVGSRRWPGGTDHAGGWSRWLVGWLQVHRLHE